MNGLSAGFISGLITALSPPRARQNLLVLGTGQSQINGGDLVRFSSRVDDPIAFGGQFHPVIQYIDLASNATDTGAVGQPTRDEGDHLGPRFLSIRPNVVLGDHSYELSLMRELHRCVPGRWNYAAFAVGGSSMASNWKIAGGTYPSAGPLLANQFITYGQLICSQIGIAAPHVILFEQGTTDALNAGQAAAWQTNAQPFINLIRATWPNVKIVMPLILTTASGVPANVAAVIAGQVALAADTTVRAGGRNVDFITTTSPEGVGVGQPNCTPDHYRSDSVDQIAVERIAPEILSTLGFKTKPASKFRYYGPGLTITFTDLSTKFKGTISSWSLDFGDGSSLATGAGPWVHTYSAGTYTAKLTVVDSDGNFDVFVDTVIVVAPGGWNIDVIGQAAVPDTSTQWTNLVAATNPGSSTFGVPFHHWPLSESAPPYHDVIGGGSGIVNLGISGGTPNSTDPSMTRPGYLITATTNQASNTTTAENPALVDTFTLVWAKPPSADPTAIRDLFGLGGGSSGSFRYTTLGRLSVATTASTRNSFFSHSGFGVQLFGLQINNTAQQMVAYSDNERFILDWALPTSGIITFLGRFGLTAAVGVIYFGMTMFVGANARWTRAEARRAWRGLGRNPRW